MIKRRTTSFWLLLLGIATMFGGGAFWLAHSASDGSGIPWWSWFTSENEAPGNEATVTSDEKLAAESNNEKAVSASSSTSDAESSETDGFPKSKLKTDGLRLPRGITDIEGIGGSGFNLAVKKLGVWFPVYAPGTAKADAEKKAASLDEASEPTAEETEEEPPLADVPLMILSPSPPRAKAGQQYTHLFQAVGGAPPYQWAMQFSGAPDVSFTVNSQSGLLFGRAAEPQTAQLLVTVSDSEGGRDSAAYILVIEPEEPLKMLTTELATVTALAEFKQTLSASGGVEPYAWSTATQLPEGVTLSEVGDLGGITSVSGEFPLEITVSDAQQTKITATLTLKISGELEILTDSNLLPAAPGTPYGVLIESEGGTAPLTWAVIEGRLPVSPNGQPWTLDDEGWLQGAAPAAESLHRFVIEVTDAVGAKYQKPFELAVRAGLIAVPSRNKAGLAWKPQEIARSLGAPIAGITITRSLLTGGQSSAPIPVYQGLGTNFVDRGLATGAAYRYALIAHTAIGAIPFTSVTTSILPMTLQRGVPGVLGDPYADAVIAFNPLTPGGFGSGQVPANVTGPPNARSTYSPPSLQSELVSLHAKTGLPADSISTKGGSITLAFADNIIELAPGEDFTVFENVLFIGGDPNQRFMEAGTVEVALFPGEWFRFPIDVKNATTLPTKLFDPSYYVQGFAGRNAGTGGDPTDPTASGGDSFDIDRLGIAGLTWIRYIRIQSTGDNVLRDDVDGQPVRHVDHPAFTPLTGISSSGFDLDAISAVNY